MDKYETVKLVGKGNYGNVYLCLNKTTGKEVAIKAINKKRTDHVRYNIDREIDLLQKVDHPNIIRLVEVIGDDEYIYIVTEYVSEDDLHDIITKCEQLDQGRVKRIVLQVAKALQYLHDMDIIHRDVKLENILVGSDDQIKLCDFGWAIQTKYSRKGIAGTINYISPEMANDELYGKEVDIWALGILTYEMLTGMSPFSGRPSGSDDSNSSSSSDSFDSLCDKVFENVRKCEVKYYNYIPKDAVNFIKSLIIIDPNDRLTADEIINHPWLVNVV